MFRNSLVVLLTFAGLAVIWLFIPGIGTTDFGSAFTSAFVIGGIAWLLVAYLSGGFVNTYYAPVTATRSLDPLIYTLPDERRAEMVPPEDSPEVMADLRRKMADQPIAMLVAFLKGLAFFGLAAVFYFSALVGIVALAGVLLLFAILFLVSRPGSRPAPQR